MSSENTTGKLKLRRLKKFRSNRYTNKLLKAAIRKDYEISSSELPNYVPYISNNQYAEMPLDLKSAPEKERNSYRKFIFTELRDHCIQNKESLTSDDLNRFNQE